MGLPVAYPVTPSGRRAVQLKFLSFPSLRTRSSGVVEMRGDQTGIALLGWCIEESEVVAVGLATLVEGHMLERRTRGVEGVKGVLEQGIIDLDELRVSGFFHIGTENQVGDIFQCRQTGGCRLRIQQVHAVVGPRDIIELASAHSVNVSSQRMIGLRRIASDESAIAGNQDGAGGGREVSESGTDVGGHEGNS